MDVWNERSEWWRNCRSVLQKRVSKNKSKSAYSWKSNKEGGINYMLNGKAPITLFKLLKRLIKERYDCTKWVTF